MKKFLVLSALTILLSGFSLQAETWQNSQTTLGNAHIDGTLAKSISLSTLSGPAEFAFTLKLEHTNRLEAKTLISEWSIPQLNTSVAPVGREHLHWIAPGGVVYNFDYEKAKSGKPFQKGQWTVIHVDDHTYQFSSLDGWVYTYVDGQIQSLTAPSTRQLTFDAQAGKIHKIWSGTDHAKSPVLLDVSYDAAGKVTHLTVGPEIHKFAYDALGQLTQWTSNRGANTQIQFGYTDGLLTSIKAPVGVEQKFTWAKEKDLVLKGTALNPNSNFDSVLVNDGDHDYLYGINKGNWTALMTSASGAKQSMLYNPLTNLLQSVAADGSISTLVYNSTSLPTNGQGLLSSVKGADGKVVLHIEYNDHDQIVLKQATGQPTVYFQYDDAGRLTQVQRGKDVQVTYAYEGSSRNPSQVTDALGNSVKYTYDTFGQVTALTDLNGGEHKFAYDDQGRLLKHDLPLGFSATSSYDSFGRLIKSTGANGKISEMVYDNFNHPSLIKTDTETVSFSYDDQGALISMAKNGQNLLSVENHESTDSNGIYSRTATSTDLHGAKTTKIYDRNGQVLSQTDALGQTTTYRHDADDRLTGWTDARGSLVNFQHDVMGRLTQQTDALNHEQTWNYDQTGRLTQHSNGEQLINYAYDNAGQIQGINYGAGQVVSFQRDEQGQIISSETKEVTTDYAHDALGRMIAKREKLADGTYQALQYTYTPAGQKASVALFRKNDTNRASDLNLSAKADELAKLQPWGREIGELVQITEYGYDGLGRVSSVSINGKKSVSYAYQGPTAEVARKEFANGLDEVYAYDNEGHVTSMQTIRHKLAFVFDSYGNVVKGISPLEAAAVVSTVNYKWQDGQLQEKTADGVTQRYDYDALGRLEQVICPQNSLLNEEYRYDASGNIVTKAVGASKVEFSYDLANQLVSRSDNTEFIHYAYDKAGRLTNEVDQNNQSLATYSYGYLDKVMSVQRQEAIAPVTFAYDASGMLVGKQKAGQTTAYQWDGIALAAKGNTLFANEDHVCGGAVLAENKLEDSASASPEYLLSDYLGTTVTPLEDKTLSDQEKFSRAKLSFGKEASADASERFTGKPYDEDLQAYVFPFRNYRSDLCRWTSTDPSGFPDGSNSQRYASVPTSSLDATGLIDYVSVGLGITQCTLGIVGVFSSIADITAAIPATALPPYADGLAALGLGITGLIGSVAATLGGNDEITYGFTDTHTFITHTLSGTILSSIATLLGASENTAAALTALGDNLESYTAFIGVTPAKEVYAFATTFDAEIEYLKALRELTPATQTLPDGTTENGFE